MGVNHACGTTGIITELTVAMAPVQPWMDLAATFGSFDDAARFGLALGQADGIAKKLVTAVASPLPGSFRGPWGSSRSTASCGPRGAAVGFGWQTQDLHPAGACGDAADAERGRRLTLLKARGVAALAAEMVRYPLDSIARGPV